MITPHPIDELEPIDAERIVPGTRVHSTWSDINGEQFVATHTYGLVIAVQDDVATVLWTVPEKTLKSKELVDRMAKEIAQEIDREIIDAIAGQKIS